MESREFAYTFGRKIRWISAAVLALIAVAVAVLYFLYDGGYISAWFLSLAVAVVALYVLSIPRYIRVGDRTVEIHCILEMTEIELADIARVERRERSEVKWCIPVLGSYGFFGYFGVYLDLRSLDVVHVYASQWNGLVEITDICEDRYLVSCDDPDAFIQAVCEACEACASDAEKEA